MNAAARPSADDPAAFADVARGVHAFSAAELCGAPHTVMNSADDERSADACAFAQTDARIAGVMVVPSNALVPPPLFAVDGLVPLHAVPRLAVAGVVAFAFPTRQSDPPRPLFADPAPASSEKPVAPAVDGELPHTDETSAVGAPFSSFACARTQNAAVMSADVGSLADAPAVVPDERSAMV